MSTAEEFIKAAKIRDLNPQEIHFIQEYAQKLNLDPVRVLVNRDFFEKIVDRYKKEKIILDRSMINSIREKLDFVSKLATQIQNTKDIYEGQKAKLHIDNHAYLHIQLIRQHDTYSLWKVQSHTIDDIKKGDSVTIIFEERFLIAYKFETSIMDILTVGNEKIIKIPHSSNLIVLAKRRYPRVEVDLEGIVRKAGKLRDNPFYKCQICNISEGGAKICLPSASFKEKDRVILRFKLNYENLETESDVETEVTYDGKDSYGLKFVNLDEHTKFVIRKYVESKMHQQS